MFVAPLSAALLLSPLAAATLSTGAVEPGEYYTPAGPLLLEPAVDLIAGQAPSREEIDRIGRDYPSLRLTRIFGDRFLIDAGELTPNARAELRKALLGAGAAGPSGLQLLAAYRDPNGGLLIADERIQARFPSTFSSDDVYAVAKALGAAGVRPYRPSMGLWEVLSPAPEDTLELSGRLHVSNATLWAHPDFIHQKRRSFIPDDPQFDNQWHHDVIGSASAWDIETGKPEIIIAIIDSGTDATHPDLAGKLVSPRDTVELDDDPTPDPYDAHGTACAGLAAAATNNAIGVAGVCGGCSIMPIRIMDESGFGRASADTDAFYWAIEHGAHILSNSWGYQSAISTPSSLAAAITAAADTAREGAGALVLFAAGNDYRENEAYEVASHPLVVGVGATNYFDEREPYSNWGAELDITAPAASVTTDIMGQNGYSFGDYVSGFGGTSAATPVVAGVAGLVFSIDPTFSRGQVALILYDTADHVGGVTYTDNHHPEYGRGRVNALRAVQAASGGEVCQPLVEDCHNGADDDCDGLIDDLDTTCAPANTEVGAGCTQDYQCGTTGLCLTAQEGFDGGYCTKGCQTSLQCEGDAVCADSGFQAFCIDGCTQRSDCRDGYDCILLASGEMGCWPSCTVQGCIEGEMCDEASGECYHDGPVAPGDACESSIECAYDGRCCGPDGRCRGSSWPGGFCRVRCETVADCGGEEGEYLCLSSGFFSNCYHFCLRDQQCRTGYACQPLGDGTGACVPDCTTNEDCNVGEVCNAYGLCGDDEPPLPNVYPPCLRNNECAADEACQPNGDGTGSCVLRCQSHAECPGSVCNGYGLCGSNVPPLLDDEGTGGTGGAGGMGGAGGDGGGGTGGDGAGGNGAGGNDAGGSGGGGGDSAGGNDDGGGSSGGCAATEPTFGVWVAALLLAVWRRRRAA